MGGGFFFGSPAPVVPDDNYCQAVQLRKAPDDCRIVTAPSVSVQLQEARSHSGNKVPGGGTPCVPRQAHLLPRWEPIALYSGRQAVNSCVRGSLFPQVADQIGD